MADGKKPRYSMDVLLSPGMTFDVDVEDPTDRVQAYLDSFKADPSIEGFDEALMKSHLQVIRAAAAPTPSVTFEMTVTPAFGNRMGNMHGGAISLVYDMCTTMCMAPVSRRDFWWFGGVSRVLSVTYLRPVKVGMQLVISCELLQIGTRLATIRGQMTDKLDGKLLSVAEHNKASITFHEKERL